MMASSLQFDEATHRYTVDGRAIKSVTQILRETGIDPGAITDGGYEIPDSVMDLAAERGQAVHEACEFLDQDDLDWETVDEDIEPYIFGYEQFKEDTGFVPDLIEQPFYCQKYDYCGTPDRTGWIGNDRVVVDLKSGGGGLKPWHWIQLAAYSFGVFGGGERRIVVQFKPGNKRRLYQIQERPVQEFGFDFEVFLAARKIVAWREINAK